VRYKKPINKDGEMIVRLIGFTAFLIASVSAVAAAEVCVACAGPDVTYRCTVEKSEKIEQMPDAQRVLEQVCTKILAKTGSHAKCDVNRDKAECPGDPKVIGVAELKEALAISRESKTSDSKVEGLLPGAARVTTEGLQKTGEAIGGGAKTAWDCVTSLFSAC
jgi:hypothetical protein